MEKKAEVPELRLFLAPVEQPPSPPRYTNIFIEGVPIGDWVHRNGLWMIRVATPVEVSLIPKGH